MLSPSKRTLGSSTPSSGKRSKSEYVARLADLAGGEELFANKLNAVRAKEKGILRSRDGCAKYEELEKKLFSLFKESGDLDFPHEDWVFDVLPELNSLENDTLDSLLAQAQTHAKYEKAARELIQREKLKLEEAHERELRIAHAEFAAEKTRTQANLDMKLKEVDEAADEENEVLRQEANDKIRELDQVIADLEATVKEQDERMKEFEAEAQAECERLRDEVRYAADAARDAQEETDLKREASRKLKEEIIDNDKLTIANINRIKNLEALVDQHKTALDDVESENNELRAELVKSVPSSDAAEEADALREVLTEREAQLLAMSRRLSDVLEGDALSQRPTRRDSILDRFNMTGKSLMAPGV